MVAGQVDRLVYHTLGLETEKEEECNIVESYVEKLMYFAETGNIPKIRRMIAEGKNINTKRIRMW